MHKRVVKMPTRGMARAAFLVLSVASLAACETVNSTTVAEMPSGYLCDMLGPEWVTLPSERRAIFEELERRGEQCLPTSRIILD